MKPTQAGNATQLTRRGLIMAGAAAALMAACAQPAQSSSFRIGYQRNGLPLLAKRIGTLDTDLRAAGADLVTWNEFPSGPPLLEALAAGSIDFGFTGDTPPIFAQAAEADLVYVAAQRNSGAGGGVLTPAASSIRSIADLPLAFCRIAWWSRMPCGLAGMVLLEDVAPRRVGLCLPPA